MLNRSLKASGAALLAWAVLQASGLPADLATRGEPDGLKAGLSLGQLAFAVVKYLRDDNAYDPGVPDKCILEATTYAGSSCLASLECTSGSTAFFKDWNVCYLDGEQFFHDDRIGDFSITFTKAGGVNSDEDGLHHPVFKFKDFNDWESWDVQKIIDDRDGEIEGNLCESGGNSAVQEKLWHCGVPLEGKTLFGHSLIGDDDPVDGGFVAGWCTAHVAQYQRNEYGNGDKYSFDVTLYDGDKNQVGHIQKQAVDGSGHLSMSSALPYTLDLTADGGDGDPVSFCYGDECWSCDGDDGGAHGCTLGNGKEDGYENGDREGDFGFSC